MIYQMNIYTQEKKKDISTPDEREDILYATATDIGTQGYDKFTVHGLVNAKLSVQFAKVKTILGKSPELNKVSYAGAGKVELQFGGIFNEDAYVIIREEGNTRTTKRIKLAELSSGGFPIKYIP